MPDYHTHCNNSPADNFGSGRRVPNAFGLLQAFPQNLIVTKAPDILHRLDKSVFIVTRRWPGLLVFNLWIPQLRDLTVAQRVTLPIPCTAARPSLIDFAWLIYLGCFRASAERMGRRPISAPASPRAATRMS